jgi:hypothetical protein
MGKTRLILVFCGAVLVTLAAFHYLYNGTYVLGGLKLNADPSEIKEKASLFAHDMELNTGKADIKVDVGTDTKLINYAQSKFGVSKGNLYLRDSLPGFYWDVSWKPKGVSGVKFSRSEDKKDKEWEQYLEELNVRFNSKGKLLSYTGKLTNSIETPFISREEARGIAEQFALKYSGLKKLSLTDTTFSPKKTSSISLSYSLNTSGKVNLKEQKSVEREKRTDYEFTWTDTTGPGGLKKNIKVSVSGNQVTLFSQDYEYPAAFTASDSNNLFTALSTIIFYVVVFILLAIIAYRRIKAYEIGFRLALILGLIATACSGIEIYMELNSEFTWEFLIPLIIGPLFIAAGVILVWAAGETIARETWKEKFISIDLATKGYIFHSRVGTAVLTGLTGGLLISAVSLVLLYLLEIITGINLRVDSGTQLNHFQAISPALNILFRNVYSGIFLVGVFFIFIVSGLKRRLFNTVILAAVCSVIWSLSNSNNIQPFYYDVLFEIIVGVMFILLFIKKDVLVILASIITYTTLNTGYSLFSSGNTGFIQEGTFLVVIFGFISLISIISLFTKDKVFEFDIITPAFVKNITERQRMQRELEIARDVQMSFLPKSIPEFTGLDVASKCIPALEVGGDYYDFVKIDNNKLGIIIGDVSGKGTQAAFYMTLTKGFLKALSRSSDSPSAVLSGMNELFYENVERGTFISMIYGIFDNKRRVFKLSRAGHNPVILRNSPGKVETLNPTGLALGLEKGILFNKTIKEVEIPFSAGDIFIFYTDGFTEALNRKKEEYGEERLKKDIEESSGLTAEEIMISIERKLKTFMGNEKQHDDMTIVVVKVI